MAWTKNKKSGGRAVASEAQVLSGVVKIRNSFQGFTEPHSACCLSLPSQKPPSWSTGHHNSVPAEREGGGSPAPPAACQRAKASQKLLAYGVSSCTPQLGPVWSSSSPEAKPTHPDPETKPGSVSKQRDSTDLYWCLKWKGTCHMLSIVHADY